MQAVLADRLSGRWQPVSGGSGWRVRCWLVHAADPKLSYPGGQKGSGMAGTHHPDDDHRVRPGPARDERQDFLALLVKPLNVVDEDRDGLPRRHDREVRRSLQGMRRAVTAVGTVCSTSRSRSMKMPRASAV